MSNHIVPLVCLCVACLAISACGDIGSKPSSNSSTGTGVDIRNAGTQPGGGFGGSGSSFDSDYADATLISELGAGELDGTCDQFADYVIDRFGGVEAVNESFCSFVGYFTAAGESDTDAEAAQICVAVRDQCLAENEELDIGCPFRDVEGCDVTIGEVEACANAQADIVGSALEDATCTNATSSPEVLEAYDFEDIPECEPVDACDRFVVEETDPVPPMGG